MHRLGCLWGYFVNSRSPISTFHLCYLIYCCLCTDDAAESVMRVTCRCAPFDKSPRIDWNIAPHRSNSALPIADMVSTVLFTVVLLPCSYGRRSAMYIATSASQQWCKNAESSWPREWWWKCWSDVTARKPDLSGAAVYGVSNRGICDIEHIQFVPVRRRRCDAKWRICLIYRAAHI